MMLFGSLAGKAPTTVSLWILTSFLLLVGGYGVRMMGKTNEKTLIMILAVLLGAKKRHLGGGSAASSSGAPRAAD